MVRSIFILVLLASSFISQAQVSLPKANDYKQAGPVNDFAQLLTSAQEAQLTQQIDSIESATGIEYAICIIDDLGRRDIKTLAVDIGNKWGIGKTEADNGVLILLSKQPRKVFIATGTGIEAIIPDRDVLHIVDNYVIPHLRQNQYYDGFSAGITEMQNVLNGTSIIVREDDSGAWRIPVIILVLLSGYALYDYYKLGGFNKETRKFIRDQRKTRSGYIGGSGSSGGGSSGGGSFGGGGGGGDY